jgi:NADH-quinone oxidoreductase subunit N
LTGCPTTTNLVVTSVVAFFSALKVVRLMWLSAPAEDAPALDPGFGLKLVTASLAALTVLLGVLPGLVTDATSIVTLAAAR